MKLFLFNNDEKLIGTVSPLEGIQNEEINKIQTIECTVVYSELIEKASYIGHKDYSDNRIFHLYKIDHVTKTSTTDVKIVGVHTFFDDMESDGYVKDFRPSNRELVGVLTTILDGSRWQLGSINVQRNYTGNFYYVTRKEAISKLIEATQIEIKPRLEFSRGKITGRYLDVFTRLGARNGKVFVHGRDLLTVSEKKSQGAIYTAVVGRGKGEETDTGGYGRRISFKDVEWRRTSGQPVDKPVGQEYVEIPAMTKLYGFEKGTKPRIKIVEFQDETDKEKLLRLSYEWLEKNSRMQVEYSAKVLNVGNLELGDTVGIFNPKLGIKYETRVFKVKRNLVNNKLTEFGIGDKVTTSPFSRTIELAKEMKNFQDDTVYWLDKIRERLSDKLINEDGYNYDLKADNEYKVPAGYYSFDKPIDQNPTKVVYMGAGKIAIANSKKPTGEWNWKTFLDGRGATLDLINTGVLKAGRIQSADGRSYWDLDTGEFHMEQSAINEAVKTVVNGKVQEIVGEVKKNLPTKEELKGKSSYLHKKYSDYADGRNMSDNSTLKYIGIYTGDKQQAPSNASEYSWTKIRGEDGRDGNDGRDGVDGKSYARNYLSGTAEEKILTAVNDNFTTQEAFKLVDDKNFRDLGFVVGDKVTFVADYEVLPNGTNKKISRLNFEWYDGTRYRAWMTPDINPTKGTYVRTLTVNNDLLDSKRAFLRADNVNAKIKITNARVIQGDTVQPWSMAQEDLRGRDGVSNYIHRKYSDSSNGANMSDNSNLKYIGIYTGTSSTAPTTPTSYTWSKIKGEDGEQGVPGARGSDGRTSYLHTAYSNSPTGDRDFSTTNSTGKEYIGTYSDFEINDSNDYRRYKWIKIKGENGRNGTDGHTLTANLRLEGTYINGVTSNVKVYLDVFYDGQKVTDGFNAQIKFKGGILNTWSNFWTAKVDNTGFLTNVNWGNKEQPYPIALEVIVLVTYKGLNTVANARMENIPDVVEIKEITKKYKTFESTIDRFDSTIGEVKQQVLANEEKRNLILGSRMISESDYKNMGNADLTPSQEYEGLPFLSIFSTGKTSRVWQGVGFNLAIEKIKRFETYTIKIPIFISDSLKPDEGAYLEIKNHNTGEVLWNTRLDSAAYPLGQWNVHEYIFQASKDMNLSKASFCIYIEKNGYLAFAKPHMCEGTVAPKKYSPAPEDVYLQNSRIESSIKQTKDEIDLKVSKDNVIASINASVEKNEQGQNQGIVKIRGEVIADNIHGKTFTGSKFEVGKSGFLDSQGNNLRISSPHDWNGSSGVGMQLRGRTDGKFNQGLNIYRVNDVRNPEEPLYTPDEVALTVFGEIRGAFKINTAPRSGAILSKMGRVVMSNISSNNPVKPTGYSGAQLLQITGIFLKIGGGPTQLWVNDGTGSNSTFGVNLASMESDIKLKENISTSKHSGIDIINKFKFHSFDWKEDKFGYRKPHTRIGLIAQEVQEIQEDLVYENPNALALDEFRLLNISMKAIQELSTENTNLKSQLKEMDERLQKLEDKINGNL